MPRHNGARPVYSVNTGRPAIDCAEPQGSGFRRAVRCTNSLVGGGIANFPATSDFYVSDDLLATLGAMPKFFRVGRCCFSVDRTGTLFPTLPAGGTNVTTLGTLFTSCVNCLASLNCNCAICKTRNTNFSTATVTYTPNAAAITAGFGDLAGSWSVPVSLTGGHACDGLKTFSLSREIAFTFAFYDNSDGSFQAQAFARKYLTPFTFLQVGNDAIRTTNCFSPIVGEVARNQSSPGSGSQDYGSISLTLA